MAKLLHASNMSLDGWTEVGRHAYVHADERRDSSGGPGSWMAPGTRRFCVAVLGALGLTTP